MRVIVFGANGLLGRALISTWQGDQVTGLTRADADIRNLEQVQNSFHRFKPEWAVLAALIVAGLVTVIGGLGSNVLNKFTVLKSATQ